MINSLYSLNDKIDFICIIGFGIYKLNNIYKRFWNILFWKRVFYIVYIRFNYLFFFKKMFIFKISFYGLIIIIFCFFWKLFYGFWI